MSRLRPVLRVLLLVGSAGVSLGVSELIWRGVAEADYRTQLQQFDQGHIASKPDEPWLYELNPNLDYKEKIPQPEGHPPLEVRYRTNAAGFRHHEAWPPRMDDQAVRILFLGDSYTFGCAVEEGEAYPFRVEAELRCRGVDAVVINTGVTGYNTEQEAARLPSLLERYRPRVCVIGYVVNDAEPIVIVPLPPREVYRHCGSMLFEDSKAALNWLARLLVDDRPLFANDKLQDNPDDLAGYLPGSPKWPAARAALVAMHRLCHARGVLMLVAMLPDFTRAFDDTYAVATIHERVAAAGAAEGFRVLDILPLVRGLDSRKMCVPADGHPNAEGQRLLGELIAQRVKELLGD
ncbi:MAG TPA: GDSL-type esterase/lipase family protein [Planctomycetota bacterium]